MTGKRPRALTRTASVSQLGSAGNLSQEFSPLLENPKERLKPTVKEFSSPPACSPRVVIGFHPKPASAPGLDISECGAASPKSAPCTPTFQDKSASPRSVLNSLFSRQRGKTTPMTASATEGVGLGIVLHVPAAAAAAATVSEDIKISILERPVESDHIAIPVRDDISPLRPREIPAAQPRRHSHPIPTPGISPCHFSHQATAAAAHHQERVTDTKSATSASDRPVPRPILGWLEQDVRRDTFLLAPSPARSLLGDNVAAALTASSHFLDECSFCKRHLPKDKDIFMYRGDKAFCSVECRSQQMVMDERSKHCSSSALKRRSVVPSTVAAA